MTVILKQLRADQECAGSVGKCCCVEASLRRDAVRSGERPFLWVVGKIQSLMRDAPEQLGQSLFAKRNNSLILVSRYFQVPMAPVSVQFRFCSRLEQSATGATRNRAVGELQR